MLIYFVQFESYAGIMFQLYVISASLPIALFLTGHRRLVHSQVGCFDAFHKVSIV